MDREKIIAEFDEKFNYCKNCRDRINGNDCYDCTSPVWEDIHEFLLSKIAEAEKHMAVIAIEQINAIEGDLMEEEHESLRNLCKYAKEEIRDEVARRGIGEERI